MLITLMHKSIIPSRTHLHSFGEGLLNLGLSLHYSTGSISSDKKPTTPTVQIQPYCALQWRIMPDPGPWSGAAWKFVKKQKQRKQPGNALAFELISTAAWRVLQGFLACSLQTAQTVMKSSLTRTHARAMCASMCRIYLSIQSASSIYPSRLPRLYLCIYRGNTAEPHSCWHSSERTCPLRKAESLSKLGLIICGWGLFFHLMCLFSYLSLTPLGTVPLEPLRSSSVRYTTILRSVSLIIVYDAQYLWGFIKALHQAAGRKKKSCTF